MTKEKSNPFKTVTKQLPFYPDLTNEQQEPFFCSYVDETELGDDPDPKKHIPVFIMANAETGEEVFVTKSYAIQKTITAARNELKDLTNVVFRFEFQGKTTVKGKPFNKFDASYCKLEDYEAWKLAMEKPEKEEKGKGKK